MDLVPKLALAITLVLAIIFAVPFAVYAGVSASTGLLPPGDSPAAFLTGVLVSKLGTAMAFVLLFHLALASLAGHWIAYAAIWWAMFVFGEIGQAIGLNYSWTEAGAGILSETLYLPLSAWFVDWLFGS